MNNAATFRSLHVPGKPLVLYNVWDAGSANAVASAGAPAVATGSWAVAAAQGYEDGEQVPMDAVLRVAERVAATVAVPFSIDIEGAYAEDPASGRANARRFIATGAVGVNVEDRIVSGEGLYSVETQVARIAAVRAGATDAGVELFINARTDLFFGVDGGLHEGLTDEAVDRCAAYRDAGADGFFVPGLTDDRLVERLVKDTVLPVNVMLLNHRRPIAAFADLGVARVSFGPAPYLQAQAALEAGYREVVGG
ncbi:MAG: isocitrate lyase/phosphoenolpyruvate mutase family protein [Pseudomonadota bacterium]